MVAFTSGYGAITTPEQAQKRRALAESLIGRSETPGRNWAEGLSDVAAALTGAVLQREADEAERAAREELGGLFGGLSSGSSEQDLISVLSNPWLNDGQRLVASSILGNQLQRSDPAYQLDLQYRQAQLDALNNPAPRDPTSAIQNYEYLVGSGVDPLDAQGMAFGGGGTTINNMGNIPAGYELTYDESGRVVGMAPIPGSPAAIEADEAAAKANLRQGGMDVVTETIVNEAQKARDASKGFGATGVGNFLTGSLDFSPAGELNQYIGSLKAIASSENLNAMRQASPTGGALGNTSNADLKLLENKAGALNPQSPSFQAQLDDYERTLLRIVHGKEAGDAIYKATRPLPEPENVQSLVDKWLR